MTLSGIPDDIWRINFFQSIEKHVSTIGHTKSSTGCHADTSRLRTTSTIDSWVSMSDAATPDSGSCVCWRNSCGRLRCRVCASLCGVGQRPSIPLPDGHSSAPALSAAYGAPRRQTDRWDKTHCSQHFLSRSGRVLGGTALNTRQVATS